MATVRALQKKLRKVNVLYETIEAAKKNTKEMVMLNLSQLFVGQNNMGDSFKKYKWKEYAEQKNQQNPRPGLGYPDLKLSGAFYKSFRAEVSSGGVNIFATDKKAPLLIEHYAKKGKQTIFGLTAANMKIWNKDCFFSDFKKGITRATGLTFNNQ